MNFQVPHQQLVRQQLELANNRLSGLLRKPDELSTEQAKGIVASFGAAIRPNMVLWKTMAHETALSPQSQAVLKQSLIDDQERPRNDMLRAFSESCGIPTTTDIYQKVEQPVAMLHNTLDMNDPVRSMAIITTLQSASTIFIPYLVNLGKKLGATNFTYTDTVGDENPALAEDLIEGLIEEMAHGDETEPIDSLTKGIRRTEQFLEAILTTNPT